MFWQSHSTNSERLRKIAINASIFAGKLGIDPAEWLSGPKPTNENEGIILSPILQYEMPLQIAAFGEGRAGKSAMLDAIIGKKVCTQLCPDNSLHRWCHGFTSWQTSIGEHETKLHRPVDALREVELWDAPPASKPQTRAIFLRALEECEVVLIVIPVQEVWASKIWELLEILPQKALGQVLFVLSEAEGKSAGELEVVLKHCRDLAGQRLGMTPDFWPIGLDKSAEQNPELTNLLREIARISEHSSKRKTLAKQACKRLHDLIQKCDEKLAGQTRLLRQDGGFLYHIEREIDEMRNREIARVPGQIATLSQKAEELMPRFLRHFAAKFGIFPRIGRLCKAEHFVFETDSWFIKKLEARLVEQVSYEDREILHKTMQHWETVRPRAQEQLNCEIGTFPQDEFEKHLDSTRAKLTNEVFPFLCEIRLRARLANEVHQWIRPAQTWAIAPLIGIAVASLIGLFLHQNTGIIFAIIASLVFLAGFVWQGIYKKSMSAHLAEHFQDLPKLLAGDFKTKIEQRNWTIFAEYRRFFQEVHIQISKTKKSLQPLQEEWTSLFLSLKALEQDF